MVIMGTNIGPEPICTNMRLSIRTIKTVSRNDILLNVPQTKYASSICVHSLVMVVVTDYYFATYC